MNDISELHDLKYYTKQFDMMMLSNMMEHRAPLCYNLNIVGNGVELETDIGNGRTAGWKRHCGRVWRRRQEGTGGARKQETGKSR